VTAPAALLVLEDGTAVRGEGFGAGGTAFGEVVFNTAMTGYQEVLTDPSYHRQLVVMTNPQQGNYGVNPHDVESGRVQVAGFVVREASRRTSNSRATGSLVDYLDHAGVVGISEVDTRALTRHIRSAGAMRAGISTEVLDADALLEQVRRAPGMEGAELASEVSAVQPYDFAGWPGAGGTFDSVGDGRRPRFRVVAYDFGIKTYILRLLAEHGCAVRVVPATTPAQDVLALEPDGVLLSNGPGDPAAVRSGIAAIEAMLEQQMPTFGICLGHQLLGHAVGATTEKLRFGHRGTNQPVRAVDPIPGQPSARGGVEITSHNHGFAVVAESIPPDGRFGTVTESHVSLNDGVNEGLRCHDVPAFSVQYHPEAGPGPHDARYLFEQFTDLMDRVRGATSGRA